MPRRHDGSVAAAPERRSVVLVRIWSRWCWMLWIEGSLANIWVATSLRNMYEVMRNPTFR